MSSHGLVNPDRVLARQPSKPSREERLEREVAPILLADEGDEWSPVDACRRQRADGVAQTCGRVQEHEGWPAAADRPAGGHSDRGSLM